MNLESLKINAQKEYQSNKDFFKRLKRKKPKRLDEIVNNLHQQKFQEIDCLDCANCCTTISPTLYNKDIEKLSKHLRIKPSEFFEKYLSVDSENDFVFKNSPCPFLQSDNYCRVYEYRPKACREYPHTDRKKFFQLLDLSLKNTFVCPAVFEIVQELKKADLSNQKK
ncbi:MAG: YkgJ family cysteine cluster protein [Bacteroidetes bacterium]|jgi:uncharacterized protein|nr:YkgJ family cysteine cluster protein [Bacteroidota bacterium]MBT6685669.1 YkgJ family cysteine cluster protein [Bacteroidota bacterium]MBT7141893.1 YkgJ family cysteine cluster protein [Bacteroidota bacterium]MBT7491030.1 YkgJ family cysteine cluster protein [Bacteroidota bacterium]